MNNKNNTGIDNSGNYNSGHDNSGNRNSGHDNSGNHNSGNYNSGHDNTGNLNSGHDNSGNHNSGWFNTNEPKMRFFNKDSDVTYSEFSKNRIVYPDLKICSWVSYKDLPKNEQTTDTKNMNGMLKTLNYQDAWKEYWGRASEIDKKWFMSLPNFDSKIFEEITGINVEVKSLSGKEVRVTLDGVEYTAVIK